VHNGIIENYAPLKAELTKRLCFHSDTDTEVLINLIEEVQKRVKLGKTVQVALNQVVGAYAIAVLIKKIQMKLLLQD
jgi:glucosamine--fructose-6-phosphate aminotransferase (isomerizing)